MAHKQGSVTAVTSNNEEETLPHQEDVLDGTLQDSSSKSPRQYSAPCVDNDLDDSPIKSSSEAGINSSFSESPAIRDDGDGKGPASRSCDDMPEADASSSGRSQSGSEESTEFNEPQLGIDKPNASARERLGKQMLDHLMLLEDAATQLNRSQKSLLTALSPQVQASLSSAAAHATVMKSAAASASLHAEQTVQNMNELTVSAKRLIAETKPLHDMAATARNIRMSLNAFEVLADSILGPAQQ